MTKARSNATANAAKGDLTVGNGTNLSGVLAVGSNGETIVADSSTATGLGWTGSMAGGKNAVINGGFDYWQRGTSFNPSSANYFYTADRWQVYTYAANTCTISQQTFTAGAAPIAGVEGRYFLNIINTNTGIFLVNKIEDVRTYAGQTVTLSFYAKASSALTLSSNLEQNFGTGGSGAVANTATHSITTSWQRFTRTVTLASISGKTISATDSRLEVLFTGAANITLSIWGVQLEYGTAATQFTRAGGTIQGELAACQRYYYRNTVGSTGGAVSGYAFLATTTRADAAMQFPVPFRITPTSVDFSGLRIRNSSGGTASVSAVAVNACSGIGGTVSFTVGATTLASVGYIETDSGTSYLGFSAEL